MIDRTTANRLSSICGTSLLCSGVLALALAANDSAIATEFTGYATLTTDFLRRGVTQSDGHAAIQLGGDLRFGSGFFAGAWGSTMDIASAPGHERDLEVDYYAGYSFGAAEKLELTALAVLYTYPGQAGGFDYEYEEYAIVGNYDDRVWLEYTVAPDLFNANRSAQILELYTEWPVDGRWSVGAGAGYLDASDLTGRGYGYWQLGVTRYFAWADVDLRYHDTNRTVPFLSTAERAKQRLVLSVQVPFSF